MFFFKESELINNLNTGQILAGLDLGDKTIGIAISDRSLIIGTPLMTISRKGSLKDIEILRSIFKEYNVGAVVLGFPISLNGEENIRTKKTRDFGEKLNSILSIDIFLQDERFSTNIVKVDMHKNISRKKIKKYIDKSAASYILQGFLDRYNNN